MFVLLADPSLLLTRYVKVVTVNNYSIQITSYISFIHLSTF